MKSVRGFCSRGGGYAYSRLRSLTASRSSSECDDVIRKSARQQKGERSRPPHRDRPVGCSTGRLLPPPPRTSTGGDESTQQSTQQCPRADSSVRRGAWGSGEEGRGCIAPVLRALSTSNNVKSASPIACGFGIGTIINGASGECCCASPNSGRPRALAAVSYTAEPAPAPPPTWWIELI